MEAPTESQSRSLYVQTDSRGGSFSPGLGISRVLPIVRGPDLCRFRPYRKPSRSGGLTLSVKSIRRAANGWSKPVNTKRAKMFIGTYLLDYLGAVFGRLLRCLGD